MPRARLELSLEAARARLNDHVAPLAPVPCPLSRALGSILAEDISAPYDVPRFTNSAMDGFAVRSVETASASPKHPVRLSLAGTVEAGRYIASFAGNAVALRVGTGAAIPDGFDAVIPFELVDETDGEVIITAPIEINSNVRYQGEDIRAGSRAIPAATEIRPQEIALLAALGFETVMAVATPRVSVVSIGPELFPGAQPVLVSDVNGPMIAAQIVKTGGRVVQIAQSQGEPDALRSLLDRLSELSDLIFTSGGVSNSAADSMSSLLSSHPDGELWNVKLRPGKHFGLARVGTCTVLCLPGNPVAAFVGFELFGRLALDVASGRSTDSQYARASQQLLGATGRTDVLRAYAWIDAHGQRRATPVENRGSSIVSSLTEVNCLILLPEKVDRVDSDEVVEIRWLGYQ